MIPSLLSPNAFWIHPPQSRHRSALVAGKPVSHLRAYMLVKSYFLRSCPGTHFAKSSLFINITTMLATFNIRPVRNTEGQEVLPVVEMVQSVMVTYVHFHLDNDKCLLILKPTYRNPRPFDCSITPRSETHKQMLLEGNVE